MYREAHSLHSAENGHSLEFWLGLGLLPSAPNKEALSYRETAKSSRWKGVFLAPDTPNAESLTGDDDHFGSHRSPVQDS
jgi:hypothetical protein